jgi:hypothetical protein
VWHCAWALHRLLLHLHLLQLLHLPLLLHLLDLPLLLLLLPLPLVLRLLHLPLLLLLHLPLLLRLLNLPLWLLLLHLPLWLLLLHLPLLPLLLLLLLLLLLYLPPPWLATLRGMRLLNLMQSLILLQLFHPVLLVFHLLPDQAVLIHLFGLCSCQAFCWRYRLWSTAAEALHKAWAAVGSQPVAVVPAAAHGLHAAAIHAEADTHAAVACSGAVGVGRRDCCWVCRCRLVLLPPHPVPLQGDPASLARVIELLQPLESTALQRGGRLH